jgi:predicted DNA-binding transcriptional regulator AlpA
MNKPVLRLAKPGQVEGLTQAPQPAPTVELLLWSWPQIEERFRGVMSRRTIERLLETGQFPKPIRFAGKRPLWCPEDIRRWANGGRNG